MSDESFSHSREPDGEEQKGLAEFRRLSVDAWCEWLNTFLSSESHSPKLEIGYEELDSALIGLYEDLGAKGPRDRFAEAVACVYETTQISESNAEHLHLLLLIISAIKPLRAKRLLRRNLLDEVFLDLDFEASQLESSEHQVFGDFAHSPQALHTLLLSAVGEYDVDDVLTNYIDVSARRTSDHSYLLVCFRLLASAGEREAFSFIGLVIPHTTTEGEAEDLALEVKAEIARVGYKYFTEWYCENARDLAAIWPDAFAIFEDKLRYIILPSDENIIFSFKDEYQSLLGLQLYADKRRYTSEQIIGIARLHKYYGVDTLSNVLCNIWRRASRWGVPWKFISVYASVIGGSEQSSHRAIETAGGVREDDWCTFDVRQEPDLDFIFERVKTFFVLGNDIDEMEEEFEAEAEEEKMKTAGAGQFQ